MSVELRVFGVERLKEVKGLYEEAGWRAYLTDDEKLERAIQNSLCLLGAFEENQLIGFIRCVGDGEHVVLIQDVIVKESHRRQRLGSRLVGQALEKYAHVRMISLYTDAEDEADNRFYQSLGFKNIGENHIVSYMK